MLIISITPKQLEYLFSSKSLLLQSFKTLKEWKLEFQVPEHFYPNWWSKHLTYIICNWSKHLNTCWNLRIIIFNPHLIQLQLVSNFEFQRDLAHSKGCNTLLGGAGRCPHHYNTSVITPTESLILSCKVSVLKSKLNIACIINVVLSFYCVSALI